MKHLTIGQLDRVCGGHGEETRTIQIHENPRFENPPVSLAYETHLSERSCEYRPPQPMPMHWLPPRNGGPQEY